MILGNFSGIDLDNRINGYSFRKGGGGANLSFPFFIPFSNGDQLSEERICFKVSVFCSPIFQKEQLALLSVCFPRGYSRCRGYFYKGKHLRDDLFAS